MEYRHSFTTKKRSVRCTLEACQDENFALVRKKIKINNIRNILPQINAYDDMK